MTATKFPYNILNPEPQSALSSTSSQPSLSLQSTPLSSPSSSPPSEHSPASSIQIPEPKMQNYCYRHHPDVNCNRQADANQMQEIQKQLENLANDDRTAISHVWSVFSTAPAIQRSLILKGLLAQCCFPQLSQVSSMLDNLIRIDFITALPPEISFKILSYLDSTSLCRAAQVSKRWQQLADDDIVWHRMCEQHIDKKCTKCGWGLPLLEKKRLRDSKKAIQARFNSITENNPLNANNKRPADPSNPYPLPEKKLKTRPWKDVYKERYNIESNWRNGRFKTRTFKHKSPVLCLQFDDQYLMTGSYDGKVSVWDLETGKLLRQLEGHRNTVSALKFDNLKLITASRDETVRVWNYRTGDCVCTFRGHEGPVLSIDCNQRLIASGSADKNIKVWDFATKTCFTLRGHTDWVQSVKVHSASGTLYSGSQDGTIRMWDLATKNCVRIFSVPGSPNAHVAQIQCVIPLYIDHLQGDEHGCSVPDSKPDTKQIQTKPDSKQTEEAIDDSADSSLAVLSQERQLFNDTIERRSFATLERAGVGHIACPSRSPHHLADPLSTDERSRRTNSRPTHILSASLDSTVKMWDVATGQCVRTLFGHIEGIWSLAADTFRVVSGSHDKSVKVWDLQSGRNWHTFNTHSSHVTCVGLSDTRLASGSDDGVVEMLCFDDFENSKTDEPI